LWYEKKPLLPGLVIAPTQLAQAAALERAHRVAWVALAALPNASETVRRAAVEGLVGVAAG
jgi:hypothetical protein